jgi:D-alanyl-D-alanine carboxypeptidase (penicillin-binding protein 5/6)
MPLSLSSSARLVAFLAPASLVLPVLAPSAASAQRAQIPTLSKSPYQGAILLDAATGKVLFEDAADSRGFPASMLKLMDLLIILEKIDRKEISLADKVTVTAAASTMGGSQVYLKENEVFSVEDLLYALVVQSANDAAVALAIHVSGSKEAFVELMNQRAKELGMTSTTFHSVHGLPPGAGQKADESTPRDMALLSRKLLERKDVLKYTATRERTFRPDAKEPFIMRTHNGLVGTFEGCDGLKTGYFRAAGYGIAATAERNGKRVIAVVLGSVDKKTRDAKARDLLARGLAGTEAQAASAGPESAAPAPASAKAGEGKPQKATAKRP